MKSHTATKEEKEWMDQISQLGCIVCHREFWIETPAEVHHIAGKVKIGSHFATIPLCYEHHRSGRNDEKATSRHPFKREFEKRYGTQTELLQATKERVEERFG